MSSGAMKNSCAEPKCSGIHTVTACSAWALALQASLPWLSALQNLEFSCQSSAISGYIRGRAPGSTHAPQDFQEEGQLSASVPRGPRLWRWTVLLFARGRPNFCPPLHSGNSVTPAYMCQPSELKNFRAGRICLFSQLVTLFLSEQIA